MATFEDLTGQSLDSTLGSNIRDGLKKYVSDPVDDYGRQFVYDDMPEVKSATFDDYPFVLVADYSTTTDSKMLDARSVLASGSVELHVYGLRDAGPDAKDAFDSLADAVHYHMMRGFDDNLADVRIANIERTTNQRFPARDEKEQNVVVREMSYDLTTQVGY